MSQMKTAALFIDAENLYFIQKGLGWEVDLPKVYEFFEERYNIYNAFYYTVVDPSSEGYIEKNQFLDTLSPVGYTIRKKIIKIIKAGDKIIKKGNLDIEMVLDMFNTKDLYQVIILFSGDSDFERALELLRTHGKEIIVISSRGYVSKELMNAPDKYYDLQDLKEYFKKEGTDKAKKVNLGKRIGVKRSN
ncbi:MAG: NYN domain-containing protein [Candidatus Gracilibacteria bacterium]